MSAVRGLLAPIARRLQGRPDSEHEQALIRIAFAVLIVALLPVLLGGTGDAQRLFTAGLIGLGSFVASVAIFAAIVVDPRRSPVRRIVGMLVDTGGVCAIMLVGGLATALFYPILLWIVFGHGFRFGRPYLFAAAGSSVVQFLAVVWFNPEWRALPGLDISLVIALILLPLYVSGLLRRLENAIRTAEDASRAKSRFLATMSHEFRTPLNAVIGMGDLLARSRLDGDQREMVATIGTAAKDLLGLVNEILDFAKIEARRVAVERKSFDLAMCIGQIRGLLVRGAGEKGLYLRLRVDPGTPRALIGGAGALQHVLTNLVANAIKFTSAGGVTVAVRAVDRGGSQVRLHFDVADTGIGIPIEAQRRIFESFEQADEGTGRSFGGTGLGLSIARELVEAMGGGISVASAPGRGSCFSFAVDMDLDDPSALASTAPAGGTALLVGDAPSRGRIRESLSRQVAELREATSIAELWPILESTRGHKIVIATSPLTAAEVESIADAVAARCSGEAVDVVSAFAPARAHEGITLGDVDPDAPDAQAEFATLLAFALAAVEGETVTTSDLPSVHARVLAADDSPINLRVVSRILEHAGHVVTCVRDGEEALLAVEAEAFDVVLLDLNMPRMNGLDTVRMMRFSLDPATMPAMVALTADATAEAVQACREAGFVDYLTKPIDTPLMLATMTRLTLARRGGLPQAEASAPDAEPLRAVAEDAASFAHAPVAEPAAVDPAKLTMLGSLDTGDGFLDELLGEFLEDAAGTIGRLEDAVRDGDPARIRDESHALRSSASNVGARALVERTLSWRGLDDSELIRRCRSDVALLHDDLASVAEGFAAFQAKRAGQQLPASPAA